MTIRSFRRLGTLLLRDGHTHHLAEKVVLQQILKNVSRSFYLSLRALPGSVRKQVSLAYLFCRVADTIADTAIFPHCKRLQILRGFRKQFLLDTPSFDDLEQLRMLCSHSRLNRRRTSYFIITGLFSLVCEVIGG